jgi:hypothetical protein
MLRIGGESPLQSSLLKVLLNALEPHENDVFPAPRKTNLNLHAGLPRILRYRYWYTVGRQEFLTVQV